MELLSSSFERGGFLPRRVALFQADQVQHARPAANLSPALLWRGCPPGTRSLALCCVDPDAPASGEGVCQEGHFLAQGRPRTAFWHWLVVGIPARAGEIEEGACSKEFLPGGKSAPPGPPGWIQGQNDYAGWFAGDPALAGPWGGYDGPGPPWNDLRVHRYQFRLLALSGEPRLQPLFRPSEFEVATKGLILEEAVLEGRYTTTKELLRDGDLED